MFTFPHIAMMGGAAAPELQDVSWTGLVDCTAIGPDLERTAGVNGWTAGGVSAQSISGDGYVEFGTDETNLWKACGLSFGDTGQSYTDIDTVLQLTGAGAVNAYENATFRASLGTYTTANRYRVQRDGTTMTAWRKIGAGAWTSIYTFPTARSNILLVDSSIHGVTATLDDVKIYGVIV